MAPIRSPSAKKGGRPPQSLECRAKSQCCCLQHQQFTPAISHSRYTATAADTQPITGNTRGTTSNAKVTKAINAKHRVFTAMGTLGFARYGPDCSMRRRLCAHDLRQAGDCKVNKCRQPLLTLTCAQHESSRPVQHAAHVAQAPLAHPPIARP